MKNEELIVRKILNTIRENKNILQEDIQTNNANRKTFIITKKDPQFSDVRVSQEENIIKTVGENVEFNENALIFYSDINDLVLTGKITSLNLAFQFRYNDPSGDGCYLWANALQLTDSNNRVVGKLRDSFINWKTSLVEDGDLIERLKDASKE